MKIGFDSVQIATALTLAIFIPGSALGQIALLGPPPTEGPVSVRVGFELLDVVEVDDGKKTVEIEGILTLRWQDDRQRFDPEEVGTHEKIYQGDYQFSELATGWWPQLALRNESGLYERQGVTLRIQPDGQIRYHEEFQAVAEVEMILRRIPFDTQVFTLVFEAIGFDATEVILEPDMDWTSIRGHASVNQWRLGAIEAESQIQRMPMRSGRELSVSTVAFNIPAHRDPGFLLQVIVVPLLILVALTWSIFWMSTELLSDRMAISFLGILTVVAFQIVVADMLPRIPYVTMLSSFLLISYLSLAAGVIENLVVGALDRRGDEELGNRLDRACRWLFPLGYGVAIALMVGFFFVRY